MKKDKEWLLREFRKLTFELQNGYAKVKAVDILPLIDQLDELKKPIVPQFMADHIEPCKLKNKRLNVALSESPESKMVSEMGVSWEEASEIYARAWLDGYEVEKEKLYKFSSNNQSAGFWFLYTALDGKVNIGTNREFFERDPKCLHITEEQIKDYDPRYWPFAVEVAE